MQFKLIFHPLNFKKPQQIYADKKVEVFSFPVKHSIPTCGFLFKEVQKQPNIKKEFVQKYNIPIARIKEIKAGADFITTEGESISNSILTTPPPHPRSYAFCTDTTFYKPTAEFIKNVDLLYHDSTFMEEMKDWAKKTRHSTAADAAKMAKLANTKLANAKKLIIGHFSARYKNVTPNLKEAQTIFKETEAAVDGTTYKVKSLSAKNSD